MDVMADNNSDEDNVFMSPHKTRDDKNKKKKKKSKSEPRVRKSVRHFEHRLDDNEPCCNNLTLIQGFTGHWKDPAYITMMHV